MDNNNRAWWTAPIRALRRGAIGILGTYFFVNGLAKGGITLLLLALFVGDNWVIHHQFLSVVIAFAVGGGILFPLFFLTNKERDAGGKSWWFF
jgi:hypothetical protein